MTPADTDMDPTVDQPNPPFLALLETDPALALERFERGARSWLRSHPTATMRSLTAAERQDVIDDTIRHCLAGDGEPLRSYSDMWGSFGAWLAAVADSTCAAKFGSRRAKPTPTTNRNARPGGRPATQTTTRGAARGIPGGQPRAASPTGASTPPPAARGLDRGRLRLNWFKTPQLLVPAAALSLLMAVHAFRSTSDRPGRTTVTAGSIGIAVFPGDGSRDSAYDVVALDDLTGLGAAERPATVVFRSARPTILRLQLGKPAGRPAPSRLVAENGDGEVAWETAVDPSIAGEGFLDLRIDTRTIPSGEYTLRAIGAGAAETFTSVFTVADQ